MANLGLIHYQPLTGPVWREPVAAALAWLPRGEPARPAERRPPGEVVYPPFYSLYNPAGLHWLASGRWPIYPEIRKLGDFQQPPFQALYKPEQLGWTPSPYAVGRALPRGTLDLTVFPIQFAAPAFDPQHLEWIPQGPAPRTILELRKLGDFVQPAFAALYKPEGLQWLFEGQLSVRGIPYTLQSSWVVDPKPVVTVTFDPQFFNFQATDIARTFVLPRALQGEFFIPPLPPGPDVVPQPVPSVTTDVIRNFSLREWRRWHRPEDEKRLRELRITPAVAEVIAEVAERQAEKLDLDEQQRLEELTRELEIKGLQWRGRYLELLNTQRQQLIDEEIGRLMRQKQAEMQRRDEEAILLLLTII